MTRCRLICGIGSLGGTALGLWAAAALATWAHDGRVALGIELAGAITMSLLAGLAAASFIIRDRDMERMIDAAVASRLDDLARAAVRVTGPMLRLAPPPRELR